MKINTLIKLYKILKKENIILDANLKEYTGFKIGGIAKIMLLPSTIKKAKKTLKILTKNKIEFVVLGNGTNVLIKNDLEVVVCFKNLNKIKIKKQKVFAESGVSLFNLNKQLANAGLTGLENSYGIPASVGGGIVQNCGAYGFSLSDKLEKVICFNGKKIKKFKKDKLEFGYRTSFFKKNKKLVILGAVFKLEKCNSDQIKQKLNAIFSLRKSKQPYEFASAGSVFKRVEGVIISKLIDELGLKGYMVGGAKISEKHAGFIINFNNAKAEDVLNLIEFVKNKIKIEKNIDLELEIVLL